MDVLESNVGHPGVSWTSTSRSLLSMAHWPLTVAGIQSPSVQAAEYEIIATVSIEP
jgi:hypothetical protein